MKMKLKKLFIGESSVYWLISGVAFLIFIGIYGIRVLNPCYTDWLLSGGDLSQHYLGWRAYRESAWHFPIGMVDNLAYPHLTSIIFTDSIPVFAVFFKMISALLPSSFQYFGIWGLLSFILQGLMAGKIVRKYTCNRIVIIVCAALTILTPAMVFRMFVHTALAGQWIILYCLLIFVYRDMYRRGKRLFIHIMLIAALSSSIHIYFVLMNGIVLSGFCLNDILENKRIVRSIEILADYILSVAIVVGILGGFNSSMDAQAGGLGIYSFNLNGFFNPLGWSSVLQDLPLYGDGGQQEGFAYLGVGFIFLMFVCASILIGRVAIANGFLRHWKTIVPLFAVFLMTLVIALSPVITLGDKLLAEMSFPEFIISKWTIFRASGRIIWVCIYMLEVGCFIVLCKALSKPRMVAAVIGIALMLQIFDLHTVFKLKYETFSRYYEYNSVLQTKEFWSEVGNNNQVKHLVYYEMPERDIYYSLTNWAFDNDKTVSNFYFARPIDEKVNESKIKAFTELSDECIFVFPENRMLNCLDYNLYCYHIDGVVVGYINKIDGFVPMKLADFKQE